MTYVCRHCGVTSANHTGKCITPNFQWVEPEPKAEVHECEATAILARLLTAMETTCRCEEYSDCEHEQEFDDARLAGHEYVQARRAQQEKKDA